MKRTSLFFVLTLTVLILLPQAGYPQTIEQRVKNFGDNFAKSYMGPFVDAFGASLNSGWYSTANVDNGISLYLGVKVMAMPIPDDAKTFAIASVFDPSVTDNAPTIFGEKDTDVPISGAVQASPIKTYPRGFGLSLVPMIIPQAQVGNIMGTRAILRFLPTMAMGDYGDFSFFGIGIQHSISQYIPLVPVDLSALVSYQSLTLGDLVSAKAYSLGAQVSKSLPFITFYGGLAWEKSSMSFGYDAVLPDPLDPTHTHTVTQHVGFDADGKNTIRATVGFSLSLAIIKLNADYSFASQPVATLGIGIGI